MTDRRILYVITDLDVGGVPLHLVRLVNHVQRQGWQAMVVSLKPLGPVADRLTAVGAAVRTCAAASPFDWRILDRLGAIIDAYAPHLVHSLLFHANQAARLASLLTGFPAARIISEIQTVEIERRWHLRVDRWIHSLSGATVGNSPSVIDHLHRAARIPRSQLHCIPGGIDVSVIDRATPLARPALDVTDDDLLLLWVGRMDPVKGLDHLVDAMTRLAAGGQAPMSRWSAALPDAPGLANGGAVQLLLAGDGPRRAALEQQVNQAGLAGTIKFLGQRDDIPRLLRTCDAFVFPSLTEGLPNALLEAMAARLPIVATDVSGNRDLIQSDVTGILVPPADPAALAAALIEVVGHPVKSRSRAVAARACVEAHYTLAACHHAYLDLYQQRLAAR